MHYIPIIIGAVQAIKSIPPIKSRADWLLTPVTLVLGTLLGCIAQAGDVPLGPRLLNALLLGVTAIGAFKAGQTPWKLNGGTTV